MKKQFVVLLSLMGYLSAVSFNTGEIDRATSGSVEVHYILSAKFTEEQLKDFSEESKKSVRERRRTFVLKSNGKSSIYMFEDDAQSEQVSERHEEGKIMRNIKRKGFSYSNCFKDFEKRKMVSQRFLRGETYLIDEELRDFDWDITGEVVEIGGYSCRQASTTNGNGHAVRVWFTEDIPIPDGPSVYHGLPGLILKVDVGNTEMTATTIRMRDNVKIDEPIIGKKASREMVDSISNAYRNQQDYDRTEGNRRTIRRIIRTN